jgi:hypothetical protein
MRMTETVTDAGNDLLDSLLVRLHLQGGADVSDTDTFAVSERDDFVECAHEFKGISEDIRLARRGRATGDGESFGDDAADEGEGGEVEKDVGERRGEEHDVEVVL